MLQKHGHSSLKFTGEDFSLDDIKHKFVIDNLKFVNATSINGATIDAVSLMTDIDFSLLIDEAIKWGVDLSQIINTGTNTSMFTAAPCAR